MRILIIMLIIYLSINLGAFFDVLITNDCKQPVLQFTIAKYLCEVIK